LDLSSNDLMEDGTSVGDVEMDASAGRISDAYVGSGVLLTISMDGGRVLARAGDADGGACHDDDAGRPVGLVSRRFKSEEMSGRSNKVPSSSLMVCVCCLSSQCMRLPPLPLCRVGGQPSLFQGHTSILYQRETHLLTVHADEAR